MRFHNCEACREITREANKVRHDEAATDAVANTGDWAADAMDRKNMGKPCRYRIDSGLNMKSSEQVSIVIMNKLFQTQ